MKHNKTKAFGQRNSYGSTFFVVIIAGGVVALSSAFLFLQHHMLLVNRQKVDSAAQTAALAAAGDLSRIVIKDPHWGYIALSDYPASGSGTVAEDGEALPILGINTVIGTARIECLLAERLDNEELREAAQEDARYAREAAQRLQAALKEALRPSKGILFRDLEGKPVKPFDHAREVFLRNLAERQANETGLKLKTFSLNLGYLTTPGSTITPEPQTDNSQKANQQKWYKSFQNYPVGTTPFYFAGLGSQPYLVNTTRFAPADSVRVSSAVEVSAALDYEAGNEKTPSYSLLANSVAIPFSNPDKSAAGALVVHFPQGTCNKLQNLKAAIDENTFGAGGQNGVIVSRASGGDYPGDTGSQLVRENESSKSVSKAVGRCLLDWVRTAHCKTNLASLLESLETPAGNSADNILMLFDFDKQGKVASKVYRDGGFVQDTVSNKQEYSIASRVLQTERGQLGVTIRNQVRNLSIEESGKHGGQPLLKELPTDYESPSASQDGQPSSNPASGKRLRESYYRGGLAVAIDFFFTP